MSDQIISYKIKIYPNKTQSKIIKDTCNCCKYVYNKYLHDRIEYYNETGKTLKWREYRKVIHEMRHQEEFYWLKNNIFSHALDESIHNVDRAFKNFFNRIGDFPKYKKKKDKVYSYFIDGNRIHYSGNKIRLPMIGDVKIKEKDYIPKDVRYIGGTIIYDSTVNEFYLAVRIYSDDYEYKHNYEVGYGNYGIDVGINTYAYISNKFGDEFPIGTDLVKNKYITKLENRIDKLNRIKSNKMEINKKKGIGDKNGWSKNCMKIQYKINKTYKHKRDYMIYYINQLVTGLVKAKPESITIEYLDIAGLVSLSNDKSRKTYTTYERTLHKHIQSSNFRYFYNQLISKSHMCDGLEIRQVDKYDASTQKCAACGHKHKVPLSTRVYICDNPDCFMYGIPTERDYNSSLYLANCKKYVIL